MISNVIYRSTEKSTKIYNSRGAYGKRKKNINENLKFVWEQKKDSTGRTMFFLNKNHPLLTNLISELNDEKILADLYINLGELYSDISKEKELEYYQKGVCIYKNLEII